jgi:hypothetical protein
MRSQANTADTVGTDTCSRLFNVEEARSILGGIGTTKLYELIKTGALPPVHIGRRTFFRQTDLETFISKLSELAS